MFLLNESLRFFRESYTKSIHVFNGRAKKAGWGRTVWGGGVGNRYKKIGVRHSFPI